MNGRPGRRVLVLGAGLSAVVGLPLGGQLLPRIRERLAAERASRTQRWHFPDIDGPDIENGIAALFADPDPLFTDIEAILTKFDAFRGFAAEAFRSREGVRVIPDVLRHGSTALRRWLCRVLDAEQRAARDHRDLAAVEQIVASLVPGDVVITFNYDTIVEWCLAHRSVRWVYPVRGTMVEDAVNVCKPHGSLNWTLFPRGTVPLHPELFESINGGHGTTPIPRSFGLGRRRADRVVRSVQAPLDYLDPGTSQSDEGVVLVAPTRHKLFDHWLLWGQARVAVDALADAREVAVIGYSLPDADDVAHLLLRAGMDCNRSRRGDATPFAVVELAAHGEKQGLRFRRHAAAQASWTGHDGLLPWVADGCPITTNLSTND